MRPTDASLAAKAAHVLLEDLQAYRGSDAYKGLVALLDTLLLHYQARLVECPDAEVPVLRAAARQIDALRKSLLTEDPKRVSLTL